jgi:hypothetical protein
MKMKQQNKDENVMRDAWCVKKSESRITHYASRQIWLIFGLIILAMLACGSLPTAQQAKDGVATAQALASKVAAEATRLAPTFQAGGGTAIAQASTSIAQAATALPTWQANAGTSVAQIATARPTYEAQLQALATQASIAGAQGADIIATVQASDLNLDSIRSLFEMVNVDANGNFNVTVTEAQLNEAVQMKQTQAAENGEVPRVQNLHFTLQDGTVMLTGDIQEPVQAPLTVVFIPYVENGAIRFKLVTAQIGTVTVPAALVDGAESALNSTIGDAAGSLPAGFTVTSVTVSQGTLTIAGGRQ